MRVKDRGVGAEGLYIVFKVHKVNKQYKDIGCGHKCYLHRKGRYTKVLCGWTRMLSFWGISNRACVVWMWMGGGEKALARTKYNVKYEWG